MGSKNITLKVNSEIYDKSRKLCKKKGLLFPRQIRIMMEQRLGDNKDE